MAGGEKEVEVGLGGHHDLERVVPADSRGWEGGLRGAKKQDQSGDWPR